MAKQNQRNQPQPSKEVKMSDQDQQNDVAQQLAADALTPPAVSSDTTAEPAAAAPVEQPAAAEPAPAPAPAPVVETPAVKVEAPQAAAPDLNSDLVLPLSASAHSQMLIKELKSYIAAVAVGKAHNQDAGGQQQTLLYHALLQIINSKAEEFKDVFSLTLKLIAANMGTNGVFNFMNMHRFTTHVTLSSAQASHLRQLLNLLVTVADPTTRQAALRQVDVEKALRVNSIKEEARQRVLAFFHA
jgi:hypothetical protein